MGHGLKHTYGMRHVSYEMKLQEGFFSMIVSGIKLLMETLIMS